MNQGLISAVRQNRLFKPVLWVLLITALLGIVFSILNSVVSHPQRQLYKTNLNLGENFGQLLGSDLYAYNGLAFYKINLTNNNQITVLNQGNKLPKPNRITWAEDKGALLTFDESFSLTGVDKYLRANKKRVDNTTRDYVWYFDFETSSIHLVNESPLQENSVSFSKVDNGFYYVSNESRFTSDILAEEPVPLRFFDIASKQSSVVIDDLKVVDISFIGPCGNEKYSVCLVARDIKNPKNRKLLGITADGNKQQIFEVNGRLIPTNKPELFIKTIFPQQRSVDREEDIEVPASPALLHNVNTGSETGLGFMLSNENVVANFNSTQSFYTLVSSIGRDDKIFYKSGASTLIKTTNVQDIPLLLNNGEVYKGGLIDRVSYGKEGSSLITSVSGSQLLFSSVKWIKDITQIGDNEAQKLIDTCLAQSGKESEYFSDTNLFKLYFTDDTSLSKNINDFSNCLIEANPQVLVGYNFYFGTVDPINGRISSD